MSLKKIAQLASMFAKIIVPNFHTCKIGKGWNACLMFFAFLVLLLSGCKGKQSEIKYTIGFSQCTTGDVWRQTMQDEIKRELSFHPEVNFIETDANQNSDKQVAQIGELLDKKIDLLIVTPNEAEPLTHMIDKAFTSGIPVVVLDRNTLSKNYTAFVGTSNYNVGVTAGMYANIILKGKGNVVEIGGLLTRSSADIGRHDGFTDVLKNFENIKYSRFIAEWEKPSWNNEFTAFLQANPAVELIYAQNDRLAFAAYKVCKAQGFEKKIKIIGIDGLSGENGGVDLVEKRQLTATILYPTGGKEAIQTAVNILENKPYKKYNDLVSTIIDSTNVRIMRLQNEKVLSQQNDIDRGQKKIEEQLAITRNQTNIISIISIILALALIMGTVLFYYLRENKKINTQLASQNKEILRQQNELIALGKKVKEATDAKFNFFTNISHELRTPLTLILGPLEDVLSSPKLQFAVKAPLEMVKKNAMRLLRLVNQLMDFRKIEEAKMKVKASENNITDFIMEITNAFTNAAFKNKISFSVNSKDHKLMVWFDVNMLDKILFNVLSNAFKYTPENGFINISVHKDDTGKNVQIKIEDSGIGMSKETLEHAFDVFYQGNEGTYKGTGLGLALSKELINLHHGSIQIKSEKGKGATFEIQLPLGKDHLQDAELDKDATLYQLNQDDAYIYTTEIMPLKAVIDNNITAAAKEQSILLIEDNPEIRLFIKNQLSENYEIIEAENGNKGLQLAYEVVPDIIISDVLLPGIDGMVITETLKNDIRTSHIPVIILTAKSSIEQQIEGFKLNADAYIVKPFNIQYLEENIRSLLKNREALKGHYTSELSQESNRNTSSKKIDRKFINEFSSIIENNIANEDFSVNDICTAMGISRVQLYRKVKAVLGYNINEYILDVRMQKAKYLLLNEDLSISEISYQVGFSSQAYFSTVFKSKFGVTPKAFKENKN